MDFPVVTEVRDVYPYTTEVVFRDGHRRVVDLTSQLWGEAFEPLKSRVFFAKACVDEEAGTVCWPSVVDLALEWLYEPGPAKYWDKALLEDHRYQANDQPPRQAGKRQNARF